MIKKSCFEEDWIRRVAKEQKYDPTLVEKVIYAFQLLGKLIEKGINLIFKGGTSIILLLGEEFKRLSIDIDVIFLEQNLNLPTIFNEIVNETPFVEWEEDVRRSSGRLKHYKFEGSLVEL
ncbi:MAG: nucleotidyl transferase AbiEii/AbiGii toxin family protein [Candidatus Hydrothermae bacterium]|nr:nucleotidyl transferase AbiEii/AbiGii toxin family protein [Candidatus Hydrothermae bacterium]